jgi:hypothetical protein
MTVTINIPANIQQGAYPENASNHQKSPVGAASSREIK